MTKRQMQNCEGLEINFNPCSSSAMANIGTASRPPKTALPPCRMGITSSK
jgi:hypothetical protein